MPNIFQTSDWSTCIEPGTDVATLRCIPIVAQNIINFLALFAGIVCVFLIIYTGFKLVTSEGDPEKISSARKTLFYALGGFGLILASFVLLNIILITITIIPLI